jgi:hypothetical protein
MCVILETLLVPQSHWTDLAPELVSLGGAVLADSTQERYAEIRIFVGGGIESDVTGRQLTNFSFLHIS